MRRLLKRSGIFTALILLMVGLLGLTTPAGMVAHATGEAPEPGMDLSIDQKGNWGEMTSTTLTTLTDALTNSGLNDAAVKAEAALSGLAAGKVPVISDLGFSAHADPFQGDIESAVRSATAQAEVATVILQQIVGPAVQTAYETLQAAQIPDGDMAVTLPTGRVRLSKNGPHLSLCVTLTGVGGSRLITGISSEAQLCGNPTPRMANPAEALYSFADLAAGYTHLQVRQLILPGGADLLATPPPLLQGETYVQVNGQWLQIRLHSTDPADIEIETEIKVGIKGGVNYAVKAEVEGEVTLSFSLKPAGAKDIIVGVHGVMLQALSDGATLDAAKAPNVAADVLLAGLNYLQQIDASKPGDIGEVSLNVGASGQLGIGIWDTGLAGATLESTTSVKAPVSAYIQLGASRMAELLNSSLLASQAAERMNAAIWEGRAGSEVQSLIDEAAVMTERLVLKGLSDLADLAEGLELETELELSMLGSGSKGRTSSSNSIPLLQSGVTIPVGEAIATLRNDPEAIRKAMESVGRLSLLALGQAGGSVTDGITRLEPIPDGAAGGTVPISVMADWQNLSLGMVEGTTFTLMSTSGALLLTGLKDVSLASVLQLAENQANTISSVLGGVIDGARTGNLDSLRSAMTTAVSQDIPEAVESILVDILSTLELPFSFGFGGELEIGAEAKVTAGMGGALTGSLKASTLLLLLDHPAYQEAHGTTLASLSLPINVSLAGGASVGEVVEVEVSAGGTLNLSLFDLTVKHWDDGLPPPASMEVAGFEVIDFTGTIQGEKSFAGTGYLILPMGGLIRATFAVEDGIVQPGATWQGGFELGPLGEIPLATGTLDNDGIHGETAIQILESSVAFDYTLQASGRVYGTYEGEIIVVGRKLTSSTLYLGRDGAFHGTAFVDVAGSPVELSLSVQPNGQIQGSYKGSLRLFEQTVSNTTLTLNNERLTGYGDIKLLDNTATFALTIAANGTVTGSYAQGAEEVFGIAGFGLSNVTLALDKDGYKGTAKLELPGWEVFDLKQLAIGFDGSVTAQSQSALNLGGFAGQADLTLTKDELQGSGYLDLLGSRLQASDLKIGANGQVSGTFTGQLVIAGTTLSQTELTVVGSGLKGKSRTDLPGVAAAELTMLVSNGQVTATASGAILGGFHTSELQLTLLADKILVSGSMEGDLIEYVDGEVQKGLRTLSDQAVADLAHHSKQVEDAQDEVDKLNDEITRLYGVIEEEKKVARQVLRDAEKLFNDALGLLNQTLDGMAAINQDFASKLYHAEQDVARERNKVNWAHSEVNKINQEIANLDSWYWGLSDWDRFWNGAYYAGAHAVLVVARDTAKLALSAYELLLLAVEKTLEGIRLELSNKLALLLKDEKTRQAALDFASGEVKKAREALEAIPLDPNLDPRVIVVAAARDIATVVLQTYSVGLSLLEQTVGLLPEIAKEIERSGVTSVFRISEAKFQTDLGALASNELALDAQVTLLSQPKQICLRLQLDDPVGSLAAVADALAKGLAPESCTAEPPPTQPVAEDRLAPLTLASALSSWQRESVTVTLKASDGAAGSGVASISYAAEGGQSIPLTTVAGETASFQVTGEGITTLSFYATDKAGNVERSRSRSVYIDRTAPETLAEAPQGWRKDPVTVTLTAADGLSGVAGITYRAEGAQGIADTTADGSTVTLQISAEGATTITYLATDKAGNIGQSQTVTVQLDRTAPAVSAESPTGWQNQNVPVLMNALDNEGGSGVASITYSATGEQATAPTTITGAAGSLLVTAEGVTTVSFFATDAAGNVSETQLVTVQIDRVKPEAQASAPQTWQNKDTDVAVSATDNEGGSGVAAITVSATGAQVIAQTTISGASFVFPISAEGTTTVTYFTTDLAGNVSEPKSITVRIDLTKPTISGAVDRPANQHGWYNAPVTVTWTCGDALSGIDPDGGCSAPETLSGEAAAQVAAGLARDVAGNEETAEVAGINIDLTDPYVVFTQPVDGEEFTTGQVLTLQFEGRDDLSGADTVTATLDGAPVVNGQVIDLADKAGLHTLTVTVVDKAGNSTTSSVTYKVKILAELQCDQLTLSRAASGNWVTCFVEFPGIYSADSITGSSVMLNGVLAHMGKEGWAKSEANEGNTYDQDQDGRPERMLKFDWSGLTATLNDGDSVTVTITGWAGELELIGTASIRVISSGKR